MNMFQKMQVHLNESEAKSSIVNRFEKWMLDNANSLLIEKRKLDFEACTPANAKLLRNYAQMNCPEFEFRWTGVNYSVVVSLAQTGLTESEVARNQYLFED